MCSQENTKKKKSKQNEIIIENCEKIYVFLAKSWPMNFIVVFSVRLTFRN